MFSRFIGLGFLGLVTGLGFVSQEAIVAAKGVPSAKEATKDDEIKPTLPASWMSSLVWRCVGPANMGGRITAIVVYEKDPSLYWIATASGGLLKTTNNGVTYEHQFDRESTVAIGDVAVSPSNPEIVWVGTGEANPRNSVSWGDGVYKSTDGGKSFQRAGLRDTFQTGRIAIHPEDPDIVYVGALGRLWGENGSRGLYKTMDGGETWEKILFIDARTGVVDVRMKPDDPETLIVATYERQRDGFDTNDPAKKWGPGSALYRTVDGGKNFQKLTNGLPSGLLGRIGVDYYRKNPNVVFAVVESDKISQEPENAPYLGVRGEDAEAGARITWVEEKGPAEEAGLADGDIVLRVEDVAVLSFADLVREIRKKLAGDTVRIEISRERELRSMDATFGKRPESEEDADDENPEGSSRGREPESEGPFGSGLGGQRENVQEQQGPGGNDFGGLYRSNDGGENWTRINSVNPRPMYYSQIRVDPSDESYLYVLGTSLYRSSDGGKTFTQGEARRQGVHVDHHALWIDPDDGRHQILGSDGGIYVTYDRMKTWDHHNHVAIGQFYRVAVDSNRDYKIYGGLQDNGTWGGPQRTRDGRGPVNGNWVRIGGGDGFFCQVDQDDPDLIYSESQNGRMGRRHLSLGEFAFFRPRPSRGIQYRFNWNTPFLLSSHNTKIYYSAGNHVFRSLDRGDGLKKISPEITNTDRGSATSLSESPVDESVLYVGTDDGAVWMTRDGGHEWTDLFKVDPKAKKKSEAGDGEGSDEAQGRPRRREGSGDRRQRDRGRRDPLAGDWEGTARGSDLAQGQGAFTFTIKRSDDEKYQGTFSSELGEGDVVGIKFDRESAKVSFEFPTEAMTLKFLAEITRGKMTGKIEGGGGLFSMEFDAERKEPGESEDKDRAGFEWKTLTELVPEPRWVSSIAASRVKAGRVYLTLDGHRSDDDRPYVFLSEDYGTTWRSIRANLTVAAGTTRVVREDLVNENILYLGTEFSAWVSVDRGRSWTKFNHGNLPTVAVHDFVQHPTSGELIAATHGRSVWILDLSALRQANEESVRANAMLFSPSPAILWRSLPSRGSSGLRRYVGENPVSGAILYYSLAKEAEAIELKVVDPSGETVADLSVDGAVGLHRVSWDLRRRPSAGRRRFRRGPRVDPGEYGIVLTVGEMTLSKKLSVRIDPEYTDPTWLENENRAEEMGIEFGEEED